MNNIRFVPVSKSFNLEDADSVKMYVKHERPTISGDCRKCHYNTGGACFKGLEIPTGNTHCKGYVKTHFKPFCENLVEFIFTNYDIPMELPDMDFGSKWSASKALLDEYHKVEEFNKMNKDLLKEKEA